MADPVSLVGTAVGVFSLGIQVCCELCDFVSAIRERDKHIEAACTQIRNLCSVFEGLKAIALASECLSHINAKMLFDTLMRCVQDTGVHIAELQAFLGYLQLETGDLKRGKMRSVGRKLSFGLRREKLRDLQNRVRDFVAITGVAMQTLHL